MRRSSASASLTPIAKVSSETRIWRGSCQHSLLAGGQTTVLVTDREVPNHFCDLIDVARLELLDVVLVATRPVGGHPRLLLAKDSEDFLHLLIVDHLSKSNLSCVVGRHHESEIAVREPEYEVLTLLAEGFSHFSPLNNSGTVMGIDNFVPDIKQWNSSRNEGRWGPHQGTDVAAVAQLGTAARLAPRTRSCGRNHTKQQSNRL